MIKKGNTMNAINEIMKKLDEIFAEMDAKILEASKKWALERRDAMYEFLSSDEAKSMKMDKYPKAFSIAGGKSWYNVFYGNSEAGIIEFIEKNCAAIVKRRNASIAKKLEKAGVKEVISEEFSRCNDGFNGFFMINCDSGIKKVSIESIYAGGYNIQCLHQRVLCKVK
jgi:hypothetical protein